MVDMANIAFRANGFIPNSKLKNVKKDDYAVVLGDPGVTSHVSLLRNGEGLDGIQGTPGESFHFSTGVGNTLFKATIMTKPDEEDGVDGARITSIISQLNDSPKTEVLDVNGRYEQFGDQIEEALEKIQQKKA